MLLQAEGLPRQLCCGRWMMLCRPQCNAPADAAPKTYSAFPSRHSILHHAGCPLVAVGRLSAGGRLIFAINERAPCVTPGRFIGPSFREGGLYGLPVPPVPSTRLDGFPHGPAPCDRALADALIPAKRSWAELRD
jgi:hypothetical protein